MSINQPTAEERAKDLQCLCAAGHGLTELTQLIRTADENKAKAESYKALAESRQALIDGLQLRLDELENKTYSVHSCGEHCQRPLCVQRRKAEALDLLERVNIQKYIFGTFLEGGSPHELFNRIKQLPIQLAKGKEQQ